MAQQTQKSKSVVVEKKAETVAERPPATNHKSGEDLKHEIDDLLDEIDEVLETNAAEFVAAYVQKGGE